MFRYMRDRLRMLPASERNGESIPEGRIRILSVAWTDWRAPRSRKAPRHALRFDTLPDPRRSRTRPFSVDHGRGRSSARERFRGPNSAKVARASLAVAGRGGQGQRPRDWQFLHAYCTNVRGITVVRRWDKLLILQLGGLRAGLVTCGGRSTQRVSDDCSSRCRPQQSLARLSYRSRKKGETMSFAASVFRVMHFNPPALESPPCDHGLGGTGRLARSSESRMSSDREHHPTHLLSATLPANQHPQSALSPRAPRNRAASLYAPGSYGCTVRVRVKVQFEKRSPRNNEREGAAGFGQAT